MTDENRRRNLREELERAGESMRAAQALADLGLYADSVSRSYYAAYHYLRALLFSRGLEPKTHGGAIHLYNAEFVQSGLLPSSHNRMLSGLQGSRQLADYDAAARFSEEDARAQIAEAERFGDDVRAFLGGEGWLAD